MTHRFSHVTSWDLYSASKMVTAYTILSLVDRGKLSLETKAADVFDWWNASDGRKDVTVRHLLSQTSGVDKFPGGLAACTDGLGWTGNGTRQCARQAYEECFPASFTAPGQEFKYTESTFFIVSAMALEVTGHQYWNDVFQEYLGRPLGVNPLRCHFSLPSFSMALAGGGLRCRTEEYAKILQGILSKSFLTDTTLYDEAERPHTLHAPPPCTPAGCTEEMAPESFMAPESTIKADVMDQTFPTSGHTWHYGLGQWTECATPNCEGGILRVSSIGAMGTYPWLDRGWLTGNAPHWGVVVRMWPVNNEGIAKIREEVIPLAAAIMQ